MTILQVLQTFHHAKPHMGSPVKAADFQQIRKNKTSLVYDPRPVAYRSRVGYSDDFRNKCINFQVNLVLYSQPIVTKKISCHYHLKYKSPARIEREAHLARAALFSPHVIDNKVYRFCSKSSDPGKKTFIDGFQKF